MKALALTTRFRDGAFEGDACLLVYDLTSISGTAIGDDVRDVLERRPNTPRIFVLAPFLSEDDVEKALLDGPAIIRAGAVSRSVGIEVSMLGLTSQDERNEVKSKNFFLKDGKPVGGEWRSLPAALREGWLFNLFDANGGLVDAPIGVHFSKASGKHASKFLRTSSVLLTTAACGVLAFFGLAELRRLQPRRIFVDTAPLLSVAFAMQRVALARGSWSDMPPAKSFSSYGGVGNLPRLAKSDLVLVSASTSGGLAERLVNLGVAEDMLLTLYLLKSAVEMRTMGRVLCDLTYRPARTFGYPTIENSSSGSCELCDRGYILAELEGDQFLLEKRAVKRLRIGAASQSSQARKVMEILARTGSITVRLHRRDSRRTDIDIDLIPGLAPGGYLEKSFSRLLTRFTPAPLDFVVAVGLPLPAVRSYLEHAGLAVLMPAVQWVEGDKVGTLVDKDNANALVVIGHLCDHATLRGINAQLRPKVNGGCVTYLSALTVADSARNLADLRIFLSYGEQGAETFTFRSAIEFMLPWTGDQPSPWALELQLLQQMTGSGEVSDAVKRRVEWLGATATTSEKLFLPGINGELAISPDFVLLDTTNDLDKISQADVYAVVCNALAAARSDNQGLDAKNQRGAEPPVWRQSVYGQCVICPSNFRDFNDAVIRAAILRAATAQELNYSVDESCSEEMMDLIAADITSWRHGRGDALPEVLLSFACGRLRLVRAHAESLKASIGAAGLPAHLEALAASIISP